jgi:hypothetical protein
MRGKDKGFQNNLKPHDVPRETLWLRWFVHMDPGIRDLIGFRPKSFHLLFHVEL